AVAGVHDQLGDLPAERVTGFVQLPYGDQQTVVLAQQVGPLGELGRQRGSRRQLRPSVHAACGLQKGTHGRLVLGEVVDPANVHAADGSRRSAPTRRLARLVPRSYRGLPCCRTSAGAVIGSARAAPGPARPPARAPCPATPTPWPGART